MFEVHSLLILSMKSWLICYVLFPFFCTAPVNWSIWINDWSHPFGIHSKQKWIGTMSVGGKTNLCYEARKIIFVAGKACYQKVVTLTPHPRAGDRRLGRHIWLPWYSYLSGDLHAWSQFLIWIWTTFYKFFLHVRIGSSKIHWTAERVLIIAVPLSFRRNIRCP